MDENRYSTAKNTPFANTYTFNINRMIKQSSKMQFENVYMRFVIKHVTQQKSK